MTASNTSRIRAMINRLARLDALHAWSDDLNPTQIAVLEYLSQANRFSRSPSHVAAYLGTTRGTVSQTLKALVRKGYAGERQSRVDKRSISFDLTDAGRELLLNETAVENTLRQLRAGDADQLESMLREILNTTLLARGGKPFGMCRNCRYHQLRETGRFCTLLNVELSADEAEQICHEQQSVEG